MTADNVYVRADGQDYSVGGTSCAAPLWAGFTALINQAALANGEPLVGFINPAVYALGNTPGFTNNFHDITVGNNGAFSAGPGWDACTGLGSPNGQQILTALSKPSTTRT